MKILLILFFYALVETKASSQLDTIITSGNRDSILKQGKLLSDNTLREYYRHWRTDLDLRDSMYLDSIESIIGNVDSIELKHNLKLAILDFNNPIVLTERLAQILVKHFKTSKSDLDYLCANIMLGKTNGDAIPDRSNVDYPIYKVIMSDKYLCIKITNYLLKSNFLDKDLLYREPSFFAYIIQRAEMVRELNNSIRQSKKSKIKYNLKLLKSYLLKGRNKAGL